MLIDFALKKLIPPGSSDPRIKARIGILHVDAGNAFSLYDYFKNRSGGIESHGHIRKDGVLEQYRDTDFQADANYDANDFALSFESQGFEMEEWNDLQLATIKRTMIWCRDSKHSIPLRQVTTWNDPRGGWGYHTLFGAPSHWTPVSKSCPGPLRKEQFHDILVPWMKNGEDDMFEAADRKKLNDTYDLLKQVGARSAKRDIALRKVLAKRYKATQHEIDEILDEIDKI